ncbi:class I SAM-dependent DNA methyltransferase [Thermodesulfobacteriota bacterium]
MSVFLDYAKYYDLLYGDKDYDGEADFVHRLIQKHSPGAKTLLDLGCGTGRHAFSLAKKGYFVTGVDQSEKMLSMAMEAAETYHSKVSDHLSFHHGDIRGLETGRTYDAVVSLFHVISYQPTNDDLEQTFRSVATHLETNGIFVFDFWYGPGVLSDPPTARVKEVEDESVEITRIANPILSPHQNTVDINYRMFVRDKKTRQVGEICEEHRMRYLFLPEILFLFKTIGFELLSFSVFLGDQPPGLGEWNACITCRKTG